MQKIVGKTMSEMEEAMGKEEELVSEMEEYVKLKREVEKIWSTSLCVSHHEFVVSVKELYRVT